MAEVERNWFRRVLLQDQGAAPIWYDPAIDDSELVPLDDADWEADLRAWQPSVRRADRQPRPAISTIPEYGTAGRVRFDGSTFT